MHINAHTIGELTPDEAAFLGIPLYGQVRYGQAIYMSRAEAEQRLATALLQQQGGSMAEDAKVALNISNIPNEEQKTKFQAAVDANTPVAPAVPGAEVVALNGTIGQITGLNQTITDDETALRGLYKQRAELFKLGVKQYGTLGSVVQTGSNGVASYILGHGYQVVSPATHVTSLPPVVNLGVASGDPEHSAHLNWNRSEVKGVEYVIESTIDPLGQTGFAMAEVCKASQCDMLNLALGVHWFRVAARKGGVQGPWSAPVRFTIV